MGFLDRLIGRRGSTPEPEPVLDAPFEIRWVPGHEAEARLLALRNELDDQAVHPVLLGDTEATQRLLDELRQAHPPSTVDAPADPVRWLENRARSDVEYYDVPVGQIIETKPQHRLEVVRRPILRSMYAWVGLALIEAADSAEAFERLRFGDWNECPPTTVHSSLAREWAARFGATLASVTFDTVEFTVADPPTSSEEALPLARTHFLYCPDLVHQGSETLGALASSLVDSTVWTFWWD